MKVVALIDDKKKPNCAVQSRDWDSSCDLDSSLWSPDPSLSPDPHSETLKVRVNASCPGSEPVGHGRTSLFCLSVVAQVARSRKHDLDTRPLTLHTILTQVSLKSGDPQPDRRRVFSFTLRRQTRPTGLLSKRQGRKVSCQKSYCITPVHTSTVVT